jgi:hypothetical protein
VGRPVSEANRERVSMKIFLGRELEQIKNNLHIWRGKRNFQSSPGEGVAYVRRMITAIIETLNEEVGLAHALAGLVPAATEGLIRDVIVIDRGSSDATRVVADAAGCTVVDAPATAVARRTAIEQARGDWLLFLPAADILAPEWQADAVAYIDRALNDDRLRKRVAVFRHGRLPSGPLAWLGGLIRGGGTARLMAKSTWLAEATSQPCEASTVSGAHRGAM